MTVEQFRKAALAIKGSEEKSHMKTADFRLHNKIFATLPYPEKGIGMVKLPPEQQKMVIEADPENFEPASGAWGRSGCTMVKLKGVKLSDIKPLLRIAADAIEQKQPKPKKPAKAKTNGKIKSIDPEFQPLFDAIDRICMNFPRATKKLIWGEPHYRINERIFAGVGIEDGVPTLGFKLNKDHAATLVQLPGFRPMKYLPKHGWVSVDLLIIQEWNRLKELIAESYGLISGSEK